MEQCVAGWANLKTKARHALRRTSAHRIPVVFFRYTSAVLSRPSMNLSEDQPNYLGQSPLLKIVDQDFSPNYKINLMALTFLVCV